MSSSFVEVCLIAIPKAHKVQKGQEGAGSTKASVARYLEEYDEQLSKNELKNTFVARLLASYNRDSVCPEYDSEWNIPCGAEFQAHLGVYLRLLNLPVPATFGPSADEK